MHGGALKNVNILLQLVFLSSAAAASSQDVSQLLLNSPGAWPAYTRGSSKYQWVLTKRALQKGLTYLGPHERLKAAVQKIRGGEPTFISAIGGSITAGQGATSGHSWPQYLIQYLTDQYGSNVNLTNGAVSGTLSAYMSACLGAHVPQHADIVFVEYSMNDHGVVLPAFLNPQRKNFERLLRKLLSLPNKPAVVLVHSYAWNMAGVQAGTFWYTAERDFNEFVQYYGLSSVSIKACCYQLLANNALGFWRNVSRSKDPEGLARKAFYFDRIHPDGETGARVMAELSMHLIDTVMEEVTFAPLTVEDQTAIDLPVPAPMIPGNYESVSSRCYVSHMFTSIVTRQVGFEWTNDSHRRSSRQKWGMIAMQVDSVLEVTVDTQASDNVTSSSAQVLVELAYLQSYEHMGKANVSCIANCTCDSVILDGHTSHRSSQVNLLPLMVTQHPHCVIAVQVLRETSSGEYKVKVSGLMISDDSKSEGVSGFLGG